MGGAAWLPLCPLGSGSELPCGARAAIEIAPLSLAKTIRVCGMNNI
jgi:plastocyanin domain-containing protein